MGVPNYQQYSITTHAQERALTRFNIPKSELDVWMGRLLSQGVYDKTQDNNRVKYHWHSIAFVVDPKKKLVITVYQENEENIGVDSKTVLNPEVKTALNSYIDSFTNKKRINIAKAIYPEIENMLDACSRMIKPGTNYRYSNKHWKTLTESFYLVETKIETGKMVIKEAESFLKK